MTKIDSFLKSLYLTSSHSGDEYFIRELIINNIKGITGMRYVVDAKGNLYITRGNGSNDLYPCIIAHLDEVHIPKDKAVISRKDKIFCRDMQGNKTGCGADDKNGIWIALQMLREFDHIKVAFFVEEEIGCCGSSHADMDFFKDCRYVLQYDRRNANDFITSISGVDLCSDEFIKDVMKHTESIIKLNNTDGLYTDVLQLKQKGLKVSCCNFSCGYYCPHTSNEYTVISELYDALACCREIVRNMTKAYPHEYKRRYDYDWFGDYYDDCKYDEDTTNFIIDEAIDFGNFSIEGISMYILSNYPDCLFSAQLIEDKLNNLNY